MQDIIRLQVIGDPIGHSLSPVLHSKVLEELGRPYDYKAVQVKKGELKSYIDSAIAGGVKGFNLTMPHKTDILPFLDQIDPEAQLLGSVNTVKIEKGKLYGYNTDGRGFMKALENTGYNAKDKNIVVMGAGGVSDAVAKKLARAGAKKITVLNRTLDKAKAICNKIEYAESICDTLSTESLSKAAGDCHILVNCTPLGMHGTERDFDDLSFLENLPKGALVYDLIYNPEETTLLKVARQLGHKTLNGLNMLIYQGLIADEIFLDETLDFARFEEKIKNNMKKLKK